jgi:hypothetical protein
MVESCRWQLQGWSESDDVVENAALLSTEIIANALEHGAGLVSMGSL